MLAKQDATGKEPVLGVSRGYGARRMAFSQPPVPFPFEVRSEFGLDRGLVFLNHGSFGSTPRCVRAAQDRWRDRLEADPIELIGRRIAELLGEVKSELASMFGGPAESFGFVTNATEGVNAVLRSIPLTRGDELVCTSHVYFAVRQAMRSRCIESGAVLREVSVPLPVRGAADLIEPVLAATNASTRLVILDHVTSATATRFPVERLRERLPEHCLLLVDGAHAPGALELDIGAIGAEFYAANLHKWVMAPRGSAFIHVRSDWMSRIHPCVISHFFGDGYGREFDWQGTRDFSGWLAVPAALKFLRQLGLQRVIEHNHQLAGWAHRLLVEGLGIEPATPLDGSCLTCMASIRLPDALRRFGRVENLQADLRAHERIEVPVMEWDGGWWLRVSAAIHNLPEHYEVLLRALQARVAG
jgi:isopenicillin-N epimerase